MGGTTIPGSRRTASASARRAPVLAEATVAAIDAHLKGREARRAELSERARRLRRDAQNAMSRLHAGEAVAADIGKVRRETGRLAAWVRRNSPIDAGLAHDALQEGVEAVLLLALWKHQTLPAPSELGVDPEEYLAGLGDAVGEVRRLILADLATGRVDAAEEALRTMEDLYRLLLRFETTRAIVALKPKQDTARALLERTRGEVTMARVLARAQLPMGREEGR
jgi:translin